MIFIWGSTVRHEERGTVADRCSICDGVMKFAIIDYFKAGHVYYIPLGRGKLVGSSRRCERCRCEVPCRPETYAHIIPTAASHSILLTELLKRTNPALVRSLQVRRKLEASLKKATHADDRSASDDARRHLASLRLNDASESERAIELKTRLTNWEALSQNDREVLLREIEEFVKLDAKINRVGSFVGIASKSYPQAAGCMTGTLVLIILCSPVAWWPGGMSAGVVVGVIVGALALSFFAFTRASRAGLQRWFRASLIPQAESQSIDFELLLGVLSSVDTSDKSLDDKVRVLAESLDLLAETLFEDGKLEIPAEAANG